VSIGNFVANKKSAMKDSSPKLSLRALEAHAGEHPDLLIRLKGISESLVAGDPSGALSTFIAFSRALRQHSSFEEESLLPVYAALGATPRTGHPEYFLDEHRKIEIELDAVGSDLKGLSPGSASPTEVVELVERLGRFRNLLDHHFRREDTILFPKLREALS